MAKPIGFKSVFISPENLKRLDTVQKSLKLRTRDDIVGYLLDRHWFPIDKKGKIISIEMWGGGGGGGKTKKKKHG